MHLAAHTLAVLLPSRRHLILALAAAVAFALAAALAYTTMRTGGPPQATWLHGSPQVVAAAPLTWLHG